MKVALDHYHEEKLRYTKHFHFDEMTPEINIIVKQKFELLENNHNIILVDVSHLADFMEEKSIFNQSMQVKSKELT